MRDGIPANITLHISVKCHDYRLLSRPQSYPTGIPSVCWKTELQQQIMANLCSFKASRLARYKIPASLSRAVLNKALVFRPHPWSYLLPQEITRMNTAPTH